MYRTYKLTNKEKGKLVRQRWDGDTYYYDVFDSKEEMDAEEERLANIDKEYQQQKEAYEKSLIEEDKRTERTNYSLNLFMVKAFDITSGKKLIEHYNANTEREALELFRANHPEFKKDYISIMMFESSDFILRRNISPDGIVFQLENWNKTYDFIPVNATIGFYPVCKNSVGPYPEMGKTFRSEFTFTSEKDAWEAYVTLVEGTKCVEDYMDYYSNNVIPKDIFINAIKGV